MVINLNLLFFILLYFSQIKKYSLYEIKDKCGNSLPNDLLMNCQNLTGIKKKCDNEGDILREDNIFCFTRKTCDGEKKPIYKNYYGFFFEEIKCSEKADLNPKDTKKFDNLQNCENENLFLCQFLNNLCTLEMYDKNENGGFCEYLKKNPTLNTKMFLDSSFLDDTANLENVRYSLHEETQYRAQTNYYLNFWVAKYYYNGTLLMFDRLENDFLQCSNSNDEKTNYKIFGNNIKSECKIDITKYLNSYSSYFYEIFLELNKFGEPLELVPIPIRIIKEDETKEQIRNKENLLLVKRMFLHIYDDDDKILYYARKVKLNVKTINSKNDEYIYLPHFEVTYKTFDNLNDNDQLFIEYTFISEYKSDISNFMRAMVIIFIILTIIIGLLVIYRTFVWIKTNPREIVQNNYILLLLFEVFYKLCKFTGIFYFWFTFGISAYWYIFFKLQFRVYYFMPPLDDDCYRTFKIIFLIGFCCYIVFMLIRIYKQISFDIFFIDWETEKNMAINDIKSSLDKTVKYKKYRSAWRMIHVVNQFNELQKKRIFHLYFAFSWIILLYFRCNWYRREQQIPRDARVENAPINFVLRNFIASIIVLASASIELFLARILQIWLPLKKQEFMDLCSVSNISVFILDELLHGYYIHGLSPIGKADVNYDELFTFLNEEGKGDMRSRGLENDTEDHLKIQSYEIFISNVMRTIYDGLYIIQTESMLVKGVNAKKYFKRSKLGMRLFKTFLNYEKDQTMLDNYMNNQLKSKIDIVALQSRNYIRDKSLFQKILGYTTDSSEFTNVNAPDIIFYRDSGQNFDDILFYGMEWEWFVMDLFIFQMLMIISDDNYLSLFCTFVIDYILYYIRVFFGNKNVSKKAVIDERFLS